MYQGFESAWVTLHLSLCWVYTVGFFEPNTSILTTLESDLFRFETQIQTQLRGDSNNSLVK